MIQIVDYGMGNLRSVQKAFERLSVPAAICTRPDDLRSCEKLVLPGVGAFRDAIAELRRQEFVEPIKAHIAAGKPFLGICLGLQLLFDVSYEDGTWEGLGVIPGEVVRFPERPSSRCRTWDGTASNRPPIAHSGRHPGRFLFLFRPQLLRRPRDEF